MNFQRSSKLLVFIMDFTFVAALRLRKELGNLVIYLACQLSKTKKDN